MVRNKRLMRDAARIVLERRGYKIQIKTGRGLVEGARLLATKSDEETVVGVRTSYDRVLSLTRHRDGSWRTLVSVNLLLVVAPQKNDSDILEVLAFDPSKIKQLFDRALKAMKKKRQDPGLEIPIVVPLDHTSRKDVGHDVRGLKDAATYTVPLAVEEVAAHSPTLQKETWIDRVKREFAERNGVDVNKVTVEFRIKDG
jgi:hypothetical protein